MRPRSQNEPQVKETLPSARTCRCVEIKGILKIDQSDIGLVQELHAPTHRLLS